MNETDKKLTRAIHEYAAQNDYSSIWDGFLEAALFTGDPCVSSGEYLVDENDIESMEPESTFETYLKVVRFCRLAERLTDVNLIEKAIESGWDNEGFGRDLFYTACGHGVGFWDRDWETFQLIGKT